MPKIAFRNFTGGEVTPAVSARYDLQKSGSFLMCCENFLPNIHGDIERRPGTRFVADVGEASVIIPFQFNTEPENNYVLIFQQGGIRAAAADGMIEGVNMPNPYAMSDVYALSFAQVGDVLYLAHKNYPLKKITRSGSAPSYKWAIENVALNKSLSAPNAPKAAWHRGPKNSDSSGPYTKNETAELSYVVTAVDKDGVESLASAVGKVTARYPTDWVQGDYVSLTWPAVAGAAEYNVYRESAGYYGFIGVASAENAAGGTAIGLRSGTVEGSLVHYSGKMTRVVIQKPTYSVAGPVILSDTTSSLTVSANAKQNAFILDGRLFVLVEKTTVTKNRVTEYYNEQSYTKEVEASREKEYFWAMTTPASAASPAGEYEHYETGDLGDDPSAPRGTVYLYTLEPIYKGGGNVSFIDQNFEPDTSLTPKEDWNPFENGNNPATVAFHQQRMVLGGTRDNPASFYMSRTGDFENFRKSRPLQDDDPVEYMLASGSIDEIKWLASFGDLLIGTSGAEYVAKSAGAAITPSDVQISVESYWGSSGVQPMIIGNAVLHCQRSGSHVRDLAYSWENDGYAGNDLSLLAPQLVEARGIRQWCFQQSPGSRVWAVREDGVLLCLTYMKEQNVYGWSRHVTQGKVLSAASITGAGEDIVMLVTERVISGKTRYFLERMAGAFKEEDAIESAFFVDCGKTVSLPAPGAEISGLEHLEGCAVSVLADGSPEADHVVKGGKITLLYPAKKVTVGLGYASVLAPLPVEADADGGSTLGKKRAYGKCVLRLHRSVGGSYAASEVGDLFNPAAWKERRFFDIPFLPSMYGEACKPISGDVEISLPSGQDNDTTIWVKQEAPMPFRLTAIAANIDFGEV